MIEVVVKVINQAGIHTRPAANIVKAAAKFKSEIFLARDGYSVNAKSIIGVMTLTAEQDAELLLRAEGPDEQKAVNSIIELFEDGFGEL
ncbi:MAG TPA: HPr family phosphocarrier protein [Candidatus Kapabacteria bacterium]|nr:HPr family phosphocarrier protein [Candidatus Kapabacteria bacterium]HPO62336.1 HPr family phosphocarrier protein [Candidatus Kapabacteria bacterium]